MALHQGCGGHGGRVKGSAVSRPGGTAASSLRMKPGRRLRDGGQAAAVSSCACACVPPQDHQLAVVDCLEDPDDTLKLKTLELLYKMTKVCARLHEPAPTPHMG